MVGEVQDRTQREVIRVRDACMQAVKYTPCIDCWERASSRNTARIQTIVPNR